MSEPIDRQWCSQLLRVLLELHAEYLCAVLYTADVISLGTACHQSFRLTKTAIDERLTWVVYIGEEEPTKPAKKWDSDALVKQGLCFSGDVIFRGQTAAYRTPKSVRFDVFVDYSVHPLVYLNQIMDRLPCGIEYIKGLARSAAYGTHWKSSDTRSREKYMEETERVLTKH